MNEMTFVERVKKYFGYLESEYGFKITLERDADIRPQTDGVVTYTSDTTAVVIDSETGAASVWFYRIKDGSRYYLDPVAIHQYLTTTGKEKELLLSTNPKDQLAASTLFQRKFLLNQPTWKSGSNTARDALDLYLANYASWLKEHADLCLRGDFSRWPAFYEYKVYSLRADHLRHGRDELSYAEVKDADGNRRVIKQSIFKDILEQVERLKKEFS